MSKIPKRVRGKKNIIGQCQICGQRGRMSFEHVPNKKAYNSEKFVEYSWGDVILQKKAAKGKIVQGGIGEYTLCEKCNNDTGSWYGNEYIRWAKACFDFLRVRIPLPIEPDETKIILHNVYPLRFLKQVVVCFFSVTPGLSHTYPQLVTYILEKELTQLPKNCRFFMNFYFGNKPKLRRWPLAGKISVKYEDGKIIPVASSIISEITHPPFALTMSEMSGFQGAGEITSFTNYGYDQVVKDLTLNLRVIKGESTLPGSFE